MKSIVSTVVLLCTSIFALAQHTLTITDVQFSNGSIKDYIGSAKDIIIPSEFKGVTVKTIGSSAFEDNQLTRVIIPNSVTSIGDEAFQNNQFGKYQTFVLPEQFEGYVHSWNDGDYQSGDEVSVEGAFEIGAQLEKYFYTLTIDDVVFENGVITDYINTEKKDIIIPNNFNGVPVTTIGDEAFQNNQLTSIEIPNSVTTIGEQAFYENQLTEITIENSVTNLGNTTFRNKKFTSKTTIGTGAFQNNLLTSVEIPNSVTRISYGAFQGNQFQSFNLPEQFNGYIHSWNNGDYQSGDQVSVDGEYEIGEPIGVVTSNDKALEVVSFYPNPAKDVINVNPNESTSIYSLDGVLKITSQQSKIDVSSLESGVYLIQQGNQTTKFIKQ